MLQTIKTSLAAVFFFLKPGEGVINTPRHESNILPCDLCLLIRPRLTLLYDAIIMSYGLNES